MCFEGDSRPQSSFVSPCHLNPEESLHVEIANIHKTVWLLRSWKIQQLDDLDLTEEQEEAGIRDADVVSTIASTTGRRTESGQHKERLRLLRSYITNMFVVRRV